MTDAELVIMSHSRLHSGNTYTVLIVFTNYAASCHCLHQRVKFCSYDLHYLRCTTRWRTQGMPQSNKYQPINYSIRKSTTPEQIHDVLITNSQTYSIIRLNMLCPSGVIILDRLALSSDCFVSMTFFSFGLPFCILYEESLLKSCPLIMQIHISFIYRAYLILLLL